MTDKPKLTFKAPQQPAGTVNLTALLKRIDELLEICKSQDDEIRALQEEVATIYRHLGVINSRIKYTIPDDT